MNPLLWTISCTFVISLIAWVGSLTLFIREDIMNKILLVLVALSAGGLLGGAFLHLLPEAILKVGSTSSATFTLFSYLILGFCTFFILEQFINWCHDHCGIHDKKPVTYLVIFSDFIHNFIDGLVIAGSFIIGFEMGVVTTIAIGLHEIPQEIGDFGVLVYGGFQRKKALILNYASAVTVIVGGVAGYFLSNLIMDATVLLLPFAAGNFIYIAASDLIPDIKHGENIGRNLVHFFTFITGILFMIIIKLL